MYRLEYTKICGRVNHILQISEIIILATSNLSPYILASPILKAKVEAGEEACKMYWWMFPLEALN